MNSLPEQHIDSLPNSIREEAYRQVGRVCAFRSQGLSEDEVTDKAKFDSVEDMYFRLKRWGLWGLLPLEEKEAQKGTHAFPDKTKATRNPPPSKEVGRELPALANATALFRDTVNTLTDYVERLKHHKVVLRDGRFVATDEIPKEAEMYPIMYIREEYNAERWEEICALHDKDPKSTAVVHVYQDASWAKGAAHHCTAAFTPRS